MEKAEVSKKGRARRGAHLLAGSERWGRKKAAPRRAGRRRWLAAVLRDGSCDGFLEPLRRL